MNPPRLLRSLFVASALFVSTTLALAFCRKTTCTPLESCPRADDGCLTTGKPLRWGATEIEFSLHQDTSQFNARPAEVWAALRQAFQVWSDVECPTAGGGARRTSLRFRERERASFAINPVPSEPESYRKSSVVLFRDAGWP